MLLNAAAACLAGAVFCFGAGTLVIGGNILTASATLPPRYSVATCHATGSTATPYVSVDVDLRSIGDGRGSSKDIIPPFIFGSFAYAGRNWTEPYLAIWNDGCQVPGPNDATATLHRSPVRSAAVAVRPPGDVPGQGTGALLFVLGLLTMIWTPIALRRKR
jgi:hypothetical protein